MRRGPVVVCLCVCVCVASKRISNIFIVKIKATKNPIILKRTTSITIDK